MTSEQPGHIPNPDRGVYGITTAAELVGVRPQLLRMYETKGLLQPERTTGGTRRYSDNDLARLRRITELLAAGLNLAGIKHVLELEAETQHLRSQLSRHRTTKPTSEPRTSRKTRADSRTEH